MESRFSEFSQADKNYYSDVIISKIKVYNCRTLITIATFKTYTPGIKYPKECVIKEVNSDQQNEIILTKKISKISRFFVQLYYYEVFETNSYKLYLEHCSEGTLGHAIEERHGNLMQFQMIYVLFHFRNMAIQLIHNEKLIHRDIKPENIFLTSRKFLKLGDFGESKEKNTNNINSVKGTSLYMPNYIFERQKLVSRFEAKQQDIYGFGMSFIETLIARFLHVYKANEGERMRVIRESLEARGLGSDYLRLFRLMLVEDDNYQIEMRDIYVEIDRLLVQQVQRLENNEFLCYLCEGPVIDNFFNLTSQCTNHSIHFNCYKEFLNYWPGYKLCPLCGTEIDPDDYSSILQFLHITAESYENSSGRW